MRVLIAEDDPTSRAILQASLSTWGLDVVVARDGNEAWAALQAPGPPNVAILDWMMPGLDGLEVLARLRARPDLAATYVVLLTGKRDREDVMRGFDAGADDYLVKPFDRDALRARVRVGFRIVDLQQKLRERVAELESALAQVRTLSGLLPICAYCKRIRDDQDYWSDVETYVSERSRAEFSHGVCPSCYDTHMKPEMEKLRRANLAKIR
jgi:DNA-binding response OmpR family regulator